MALVFTMVSAAVPSASSGTPVHPPLSPHLQAKQDTESTEAPHQLRQLHMRQSPEIICGQCSPPLMTRVA